MLGLIIQLLSALQKSPFLKILGVRSARIEAFQHSLWALKPEALQETVWFHAASLGELEMLRPLIEDFHQQGHLVGVSAFSDSALKGLEYLKPICVFAGLSPPENEWERIFAHFRVKKLVLAKYDSWPGLLRAAQLRDAPVIIINAQNRKSLRLLKSLFRYSFSRFPRLFFFANQKKIADALLRDFKKIAEVGIAPDPRWERVARRKENTIYDAKLRALIERITQITGRVGIVGSAWLEDLEMLMPALESEQDSVVIVPHDLSEKNILEIKAKISTSGMPERILLVDQMGMLAELYQTADWVWVGGGFSKGIHSLIEPAFHAVPIACGPKHFELFPEAEELRANGVLTLCQTAEETRNWLRGRAHEALASNELWEKRSGYRALLEECIRIQ